MILQSLPPTSDWTLDAGLEVLHAGLTIGMKSEITIIDSDNFDDNSLDPARWNPVGTVAETNQQLQITGNGVWDSNGVVTDVARAAASDLRFHVKYTHVAGRSCIMGFSNSASLGYVGFQGFLIQFSAATIYINVNGSWTDLSVAPTAGINTIEIIYKNPGWCFYLTTPGGSRQLMYQATTDSTGPWYSHMQVYDPAVYIFDDWQVDIYKFYADSGLGESPWIPIAGDSISVVAFLQNRINGLNVLPNALPNFSLTAWKPFSNQALQPGAGGSWEEFGVFSPCVIKKGTTIYIFYYGQNNAGVNKVGVASVSEATFNGVNFVKSPSNPILSGTPATWDSEGVSSPYVIYDSSVDLFKMWYTGKSIAGVFALGYATCPGSSDPLNPANWTKHSGNPIMTPAGWEGNYLYSAVVVKHAANDYRMIYTGMNDPTIAASLGYATSVDGIAWTKHSGNPVLSASGSGWCQLSVFFPLSLKHDGSQWYLYYCGKSVAGASRIGCATSADLITWSVDNNNPILAPSLTWEGFEVEQPNYFYYNGFHYIYYSCWGGSPRAIGLTKIAEPLWFYALNNGAYTSTGKNLAELMSALSGASITDHTNSLKLKWFVNSNENKQQHELHIASSLEVAQPSQAASFNLPIETVDISTEYEVVEI